MSRFEYQPSRFEYQSRKPVYAVKWDGDDWLIILDFIQEICMGHLGWNYYDTAEEFVDFVGDKVLFRSGSGILLLDHWAYVEPGGDEILSVPDATFWARFMKRNSS